VSHRSTPRLRATSATTVKAQPSSTFGESAGAAAAARPVGRKEVATALAKVPLFQRCTKGDLRIVARHAEVLSVPAGSLLVRQGEPGDAFFVVLDGRAEVQRDGHHRQHLHAGDHFGELALLDPAPRAASVVALGDVVVAALGARMFRVLLAELPLFSAHLLGAMAARLRDADPALDDDDERPAEPRSERPPEPGR
jgi:cAMP-dependent protein kinase regulator